MSDGLTRLGRKGSELLGEGSGAILAACSPIMRSSVPASADPTVLAQLHAALDHIHETQTAIEAIRATGHAPGYVQPVVRRLEALVNESRELLRSLLTRDRPFAIAR
jgi:hypothetical protein